MVVHQRRAAWTAGLCMMLIGTMAGAEVVATTDRDRIEANESFTLDITIDSTPGVAPDLSVLEGDFEVGQTNQLTEAHIINGQVRRSVSWKILLTPRRAGELTIPAIEVAGEHSEPLTITVVEPAYAAPGEADVFLASEIDYEETYVQAQVLYRIKIYRAVATRQPALREPVFTGAEVLVEQASDERNYEAILNGRAYNVVEYAFAIFPQASGEVSISPARFEARVLRDGRITGRKIFESNSHVITVKPIPPPPAAYPDAAWLPAHEVNLSQNWSREPDNLRAGEPISRDITVSALGQLETQIPVLEPPVVAGVNIYPDRPVLARELETRGIRGIRTDTYAMIGGDAGDLELPALELPWWDIDAAEWRVASLPAQSLSILPGPQSSAPPPVEAEPAPASDAGPAPVAPPEVVYSGFWRQVAVILALVWLVTLGAWWWSSRPRRELREPRPVPLHKQQAKYLKAARAAALAQDGRGLREALLAWSALEWPERPPRSIGDVASRVAPPLSEELARLSRASYGAGEVRWDGAAMTKALRKVSPRREERSATPGDILPPLMPG
jgi:hypothetical protein